VRDVAAEAIGALLSKIEWMPIPGTLGVIDEEAGAVSATHCGVIELRGFRLRCFQLSNGQRVFDLDDVEKMFNGTSGAA
jgi:hypothetical protein